MENRGLKDHLLLFIRKSVKLSLDVGRANDEIWYRNVRRRERRSYFYENIVRFHLE